LLPDPRSPSPWSRQLDKVQDAKLIADYSRPEFVPAGCKPRL